MTTLSSRDAELVVLGAAIASNCIKCVEHHILEAKKIGLTESEIRAAVNLADQVRAVPAKAVLEAAGAANGAQKTSSDNLPSHQECSPGANCC